MINAQKSGFSNTMILTGNFVDTEGKTHFSGEMIPWGKAPLDWERTTPKISEELQRKIANRFESLSQARAARERIAFELEDSEVLREATQEQIEIVCLMSGDLGGEWSEKLAFWRKQAENAPGLIESEANDLVEEIHRFEAAIRYIATEEKRQLQSQIDRMKPRRALTGI